MEIRFKLNPKNEKDKVIMDVLAGEYSPTDTIKNILYKIGTGGYGGIIVSFGGSVTNVNINSNRQYTPLESTIGNEKEEELTPISDDNSKALDEEMASFFIE
ncbi:hypothetical protein [uncultured Clostridium sp.]|mgnify:FL=1|uniref:hypothetical protein n=1 Tax=uncultured Clostridium sp. TaxID=59620 RepID=UPI00258421A2|nr:hypothetical protein [uncultured Clostridium sp.]